VLTTTLCKLSLQLANVYPKDRKRRHISVPPRNVCIAIHHSVQIFISTAHVIPPQSCRIALRTHVQNHLAVLVHIVDATCWLSNQCHLPSVYSRVLKNHLQSVLMDMCIAVFQYRIPVPSLGQYRCRIEVKYKYITRNHLLSSTHCSLRLKC
jgi:hypothetical protein